MTRPTCLRCTNDHAGAGDFCAYCAGAVERERQQMHDARNLAQVAINRGADFAEDRVRGLVWLRFEWRTHPDADDIVIRDLAVTLVEEKCTEAELAVWRGMRGASEDLTSLAGFYQQRHHYAAVVADTVRGATVYE
jgi:hypothetical protein